MKSFPSKSTGFSLIEMLLVLGVIALLLVGMFVIYPQVRTANQVNTEVTNLLAIRANMKSMFANGGVYSVVSDDDLTRVANQGRVFPVSMNGGDYNANRPVNVWGGEVSLTSTTGTNMGTTAGRAFVIRYRNVPIEACVALVAGTINSFKTIQVNYISGQAGENMNRDTYTMEGILERCNRRDVATVNFVD